MASYSMLIKKCYPVVASKSEATPGFLTYYYIGLASKSEAMPMMDTE